MLIDLVFFSIVCVYSQSVCVCALGSFKGTFLLLLFLLSLFSLFFSIFGISAFFKFFYPIYVCVCVCAFFHQGWHIYTPFPPHSLDHLFILTKIISLSSSTYMWLPTAASSTTCSWGKDTLHLYPSLHLFLTGLFSSSTATFLKGISCMWKCACVSLIRVQYFSIISWNQIDRFHS